MKSFILALMVLGSTFLFAEEPKEVLFKIAGKYITFVPKDKVLVNKICNNGCIGFDKLKKLKNFKILPDKDSPYAQSTGAYVCHKLLNGDSLMGIASNKDMAAFCYFKDDQSILEMNSLGDYSEKFKLSNK